MWYDYAITLLPVTASVEVSRDLSFDDTTASVVITSPSPRRTCIQFRRRAGKRPGIHSPGIGASDSSRDKGVGALPDSVRGGPMCTTCAPSPRYGTARSHNVALLNKLNNHELRRWYGSRAVRHGWSVAVLEHQILTSLHTRSGAAPNSLEARLPGEGTDLAREVAKDPLVLDFPRSDQGRPGTGQACPSNLSKLHTAS